MHRVSAHAFAVIAEGGQDWTDAVLAAIDETTAIVRAPQMRWIDGAWLDLDRIARRVHDLDAALVVDASQSLEPSRSIWPRCGRTSSSASATSGCPPQWPSRPSSRSFSGGSSITASLAAVITRIDDRLTGLNLDRLTRQHGLGCPCPPTPSTWHRRSPAAEYTPRFAGRRWASGPHLHTTDQDVDRLVDAVQAAVG
jgi:hypothetical protein